jgi:hypothetical protein
MRTLRLGYPANEQGDSMLYRSYFACAFIFLLAVSGSQASADPAPAEDEGTQQPYFDRLMGGAFYEKRIDLVLAKVVGPLKKWPDGFNAGYSLEIFADYRGDLKEHQQVSMFGQRRQIGSNFSPLEELVTNDVMLLAIVPLERSGEFQHRELATPIGLGCPHTVKPEGIAGVKQALAELRRLVPQDGKGEVPRAEAYRLLTSKEPLLWALGSTLVAYDPAPGDVESLKRMVNTMEGLTLSQAVWVHYLLTWVVPEDKRPTKADSDALLVGYVRSHSKPLEP